MASRRGTSGHDAGWPHFTNNAVTLVNGAGALADMVM